MTALQHLTQAALAQEIRSQLHALFALTLGEGHSNDAQSLLRFRGGCPSSGALGPMEAQTPRG